MDVAAVDQLSALVGAGGVVVLSGAGLSTESGIPDYRGPRAVGAKRPTPMSLSEFTANAAARRRYWARSHAGWPVFDGAAPNAGHRAVTALQRAGLVDGIITQNVDGLHQAAGADHVLDLHGQLRRVICLSCGASTARHALQQRLDAANPGRAGGTARLQPDGDVDLPEDVVEEFVVVPCDRCGGVLKPDVVFFGENVPADRVAAGYALVDGASSLLVLGSSLTVFSGRRFVMRAVANSQPVAIVNDGPTRADDLVTLRLVTRLGAALNHIADRLAATDSGRSGLAKGAD
jgi:NAD-dependent SIR2 family protein deacetylase